MPFISSINSPYGFHEITARSKGIVTSESLEKSSVSGKGSNPMVVVATKRVAGSSKME
jgi:hypothetical protein